MNSNKNPWPRLLRIFASILAICVLGTQPTRGQSNAWQQLGLPNTQIYALASDPHDPQIILAGTLDAGVFRSEDGGLTWRSFNEGLPNLFNPAVVIAHDGTAYVGTYGNGVYRIPAGQTTWTPIRAGLTSLYIYSLAADSAGNIYAGTSEKGLFRLAWGSSAWTSQNLENYTITALALAPTHEQTIYAGTWEGGVFRSEDGGDTWLQVNEGLSLLNVRALAVDPQAQHTVYVGTWGGGAYRSFDGGAQWHELNAGLTSRFLYALATRSCAEGMVYAGTDGSGTYKLDASDTLWLPYGPGNIQVRSLLIIPQAPGYTILAGTKKGIWAHTVQPSLQFKKEVQPDGIAKLGDVLTYTLHYTNTGEIKLTDIVINDRIPLGTTYKTGSADASGGQYILSQNWVEWTRSVLRAGDAGQVSFAVQLPPPPTATPTNTPTSSPTASHTTTATTTPTATDTATATPSDTWTVTLTSSPTATDTLTPTSTLTRTVTLTPTLTATWSPTASATVTLTATATVSATISLTPSATLTITNTPTMTASPTGTITATATAVTSVPSVTATSTPTPSSTRTATSTLVASPSATPTSNTPTPTWTPTPICIDFLANGNFETGALDGWNTVGAATIVTTTKHFGRYAAQLGGENNAQDELCQFVTIPSDTVSVSLSYWWYMTTEQVAHPRDQLYVELRDEQGQFLANLHVVDDGAEQNKWKASPSMNLAAWAGQSVWLCFVCQTNREQPSWFYIDDARLQVCTMVPAAAAISPGRPLPPRPWNLLNAGQAEDGVPVFNVASFYSTQTGWVKSNAVLNSPRRVLLPLVIKS